jgi:hypothetical protein
VLGLLYSWWRVSASPTWSFASTVDESTSLQWRWTQFYYYTYYIYLIDMVGSYVSGVSCTDTSSLREGPSAMPTSIWWMNTILYIIIRMGYVGITNLTSG